MVECPKWRKKPMFKMKVWFWSLGMFFLMTFCVFVSWNIAASNTGVHPPVGKLLARIQVDNARTVLLGGGRELSLWGLHRSGVCPHSQLLLPEALLGYPAPRNEDEAGQGRRLSKVGPWGNWEAARLRSRVPISEAGGRLPQSNGLGGTPPVVVFSSGIPQP